MDRVVLDKPTSKQQHSVPPMYTYTISITVTLTLVQLSGWVPGNKVNFLQASAIVVCVSTISSMQCSSSKVACCISFKISGKKSHESQQQKGPKSRSLHCSRLDENTFCVLVPFPALPLSRRASDPPKQIL
jgi:hypothetical protein